MEPTEGTLEYRLLRPPEWRWADDHVQILDPRVGRWIAIADWSAKLLDGVASEERLDALVARLNEGKRPRAHRETRARRFLFNLWRLGYVDLPVRAPDVFAKRYERVRELGRGGIGVAHLCRDLDREGELVVVKHAWSFLQRADVAEASTRREAVVLARLDHPGVVRLRGSFEVDDALHVVRDFVDGNDLAELHRAPLGDPRAERDIARQVADVVGHLHERGFVLIDLRPANFLRARPTGRVMLIDVGQCRDVPPTGAVRLPAAVGSAGFMPPEMERDHIASVRGDVWGLGRIVTFLATGEIPSAGAALDEVLARLHPRDAAVVARLCAADPGARPESMRDASALLSA